MILLKISYWIAFASAATCLLAAIAMEEFLFAAPAIGGFIGGSLIAGLDRIVELLTPVRNIEIDEPSADEEPSLASLEPEVDREHYGRGDEAMRALEERLAAAKMRQRS